MKMKYITYVAMLGMATQVSFAASSSAAALKQPPSVVKKRILTVNMGFKKDGKDVILNLVGPSGDFLKNLFQLSDRWHISLEDVRGCKNLIEEYNNKISGTWMDMLGYISGGYRFPAFLRCLVHARMAQTLKFTYGRGDTAPCDNGYRVSYRLGGEGEGDNCQAVGFCVDPKGPYSWSSRYKTDSLFFEEIEKFWQVIAKKLDEEVQPHSAQVGMSSAHNNSDPQ